MIRKYILAQQVQPLFVSGLYSKNIIFIKFQVPKYIKKKQIYS